MSDQNSSPHLDQYRPYLDGFDLSEPAKTELLRVLWLILTSFVDRAFEDDPVQQAVKVRRERDSLGTYDLDVAKSVAENSEDSGLAPVRGTRRTAERCKAKTLK